MDTFDIFYFESMLEKAREAWRISDKYCQKPMKRYALRSMAESMVFLDRMQR